jgi:hypothetical protein
MTMKLKSILVGAMALTSMNSFAKINLSAYQQNIGEIKALEKSQKYKEAAVKASLLSAQIASNIKMDEVVNSVDSVLNIEQEEVVVSHKNESASFRILGGLFSGSLGHNYNTTKIIQTNSEEVYAFSTKKQRSFAKLQKQLKAYIAKNETDIFYSKVFAAKALQLAAKMNVENIQEVYSLVTKTAQQVEVISFLGVQNISECIETNHAARVDGLSASLKGFLLSFNVGDKTTYNAYEETSCENSVNAYKVNENDIASFELRVADENLIIEGKNLSLKMLKATAPTYPTWGW